MSNSLFPVDRSVEFSECRRYRYRLQIRWDDGPACNFLMLNPSKADEIDNDPTVERCERRASSWGYGSLIVTNLFAWRSTDPAGLKQTDDPIGPDNDAAIIRAARESAIVICGWGEHGKIGSRAVIVRDLLWNNNIQLHALNINTSGEPTHPLFLPYSLKPVPFSTGEDNVSF